MVNNLKIMIVDDEKLLRKGFQYMTNWQSKGIEVVAEASNGTDALAKLETTNVDVILTDINMPVMNGIELTKQVKNLYPQIIVVVLSGYDDYNFIRESMKNGASDYLLKASIDIEELYETLKKLTISKKGHLNIPVDTISDNLWYNEGVVLDFLEIKEFDKLKTYIFSLIENSNNFTIFNLQENLRDLFFFIQFHLERLNQYSEDIEKRKFVNSNSVSLINDYNSAFEWVSFLLDEFEKKYNHIISPHKQKIDRVNKYVIQNYNHPDLSLSTIACELHLNKNYLCDIFKSETGFTINQFIINTRINYAKEFIRNNDDFSLQEISEKVGYSDYNYFSRVFKKITGMSPRSYSKMYLSK